MVSAVNISSVGKTDFERATLRSAYREHFYSAYKELEVNSEICYLFSLAEQSLGRNAVKG